EIKSQLEALTVRVPAQAGSTGRLFGAVTVADIVAAVKAAGGPDIDKRRIQVDQPIKAVGPHEVQVKVHDEVQARLSLDVVAS
ncbi:MAG: 50S ribosomal protein L9, partial [Actinomycetota bacterium]|nr:50S ribosomal protein L9 [Actinomycetota bacterium]